MFPHSRFAFRHPFVFSAAEYEFGCFAVGEVCFTATDEFGCFAVAEVCFAVAGEFGCGAGQFGCGRGAADEYG
jgi:hypothetical protein